MLSLIRSVLAPLLSFSLMILASGLFGTFISLRLEIEGHTPDTIGLIISFLYAGILVGSIYIAKFIERWGYSRSFSFFILISTLVILIQGAWVDPYYWGILRFVYGICLAGTFIIVESWILLESPPELRGAALSLYLGVSYASLSLGQFLIHLADPQTFSPFLLAASLCVTALFPILLKRSSPKIEKTTSLSLYKLFKISPLGFLGGLVSGTLLASIYGLVPVYGKKLGLQVSQIGILMGVLILGGLIFQFPVARFSNIKNRKKFFSFSCFSTAALGSLIATLESPSLSSLYVLAGLFGGFAFAIYPISMAYVCEKLETNQLVAATGGFVLSYGLGAIVGPILAPVAMNHFGSGGLFYFFALITLFLGLFGLKKSKPTVS